MLSFSRFLLPPTVLCVKEKKKAKVFPAPILFLYMQKAFYDIFLPFSLLLTFSVNICEKIFVSLRENCIAIRKLKCFYPKKNVRE